MTGPTRVRHMAQGMTGLATWRPRWLQRRRDPRVCPATANGCGLSAAGGSSGYRELLRSQRHTYGRTGMSESAGGEVCAAEHFGCCRDSGSAVILRRWWALRVALAISVTMVWSNAAERR